MDNIKVNKMCEELRMLLRGLEAPKYTQTELLRIMLDQQGREQMDDALCVAKGINGKRFKEEQNPQRRAQLLNKAVRYLEAQTLIREIAEELSAE